MHEGTWYLFRRCMCFVHRGLVLKVFFFSSSSFYKMNLCIVHDIPFPIGLTIHRVEPNNVNERGTCNVNVLLRTHSFKVHTLRYQALIFCASIPFVPTLNIFLFYRFYRFLFDSIGLGCVKYSLIFVFIWVSFFLFFLFSSLVHRMQSNPLNRCKNSGKQRIILDSVYLSFFHQSIHTTTYKSKIMKLVERIFSRILSPSYNARVQLNMLICAKEIQELCFFFFFFFWWIWNLVYALRAQWNQLA